MSKFTKICLGFCVVTVILGIILSVIGFSMGAGKSAIFDWKKGTFNVVFDDDNDAFNNDAFNNDSFSDIKDLDIDVKCVELNVFECDGEEIKVEAKNVTDAYKCLQEGDKLIVEYEKEVEAQFIKACKDKLAEINIYIPKDKELGEVSIKVGAFDSKIDKIDAEEIEILVGAGNAIIDEIVAKEKCDIDIGAGDIEIRNYEGTDTTVSVGAGDLNLAGKFSGDTDIDCGLGSIEVKLTNKKKDYNYDISGGMGEIEVGQAKYSGAGFEDYIDNDADNDMKIECGMGSVKVKFADTL